MEPVNIITAGLAEVKELLRDGTWRSVDRYELNSQSESWGCGLLLHLTDRAHIDPFHALSYMLQSAVLCASFNASVLVDDQEVYFEMIQGFQNEEGRVVAPKEFWQDFFTIVNGIAYSWGAQILRNGRAASRIRIIDLVMLEHITQAWVFNETWNDKRYLVKIMEDWLYFEWSCSA